MDLRSLPTIVILGGMAVICLGLPISLYAVFTMDQRRTTRELRRGATARDWRYRSRSGGFCIEGSTGGVAWMVTSGNSSEGEMRWSTELDLRLPSLAGETDIAVFPRDGKPLPTAGLSPAMVARIGTFSSTLAGALRFVADAHEIRTGVQDFDAVYEVRVRQTESPLVDAALAGRIMHWPADAVAPHSIAAWRDAFGFHCNARLPGPPNWATVVWLTDLGGEFIASMPGSV